jgi:kanamycin kinase
MDVVTVPAPMYRLAGSRRLVPVWSNDDGVVTCALFDDDAGQARYYLKWAPPGSPARMAAEAERLAWAVRYTPVPPVVEVGEDEHGTWLMTEAVPGTCAVLPRWRADPRTAVRAIGEGLRSLHESLPVAQCPFSWSAEERVARALARQAQGGYDPEAWRPEHGMGIDEAIVVVGQVPEVDRTVVCHGDPCCPNTLLDEDGRWSAHVDFDSMGTADRWADLAVATWSCGWNYGNGWEAELLAAYGMAPDAERTRYYRLLWDLA